MSKRILIVDDAAFTRELLRDILTEEGYQIAAEAADGAAAVAAYAEHSPDMVMLDIIMPRMSGLEALREIVAHDPKAKVVMCSALGQESLVTEALDAGAEDFVVKPFRLERVIGVIEKVLSKS
jgi:two-component system chemotaxis response regulator CheY